MQELHQALSVNFNQLHRPASLECRSKISKPRNNLLRSHREQTQRMEQQLEQSFQRLSQLEDENRKLKEESWAMRETAEKLTTEKQALIQKLEQKVENINQLQTYLLEENEFKNSEWSHKSQSYNSELALKKKELEYLKQEYKEQLRQKDEIIYSLEESLENQKLKVEEFLKSDHILNQKLAELEIENEQLEKDLIESQTSLFEIHKSVAEEKIKDVEIDEGKLSLFIQQRTPTVETQTDTTYAIQNLEDKIQRLKLSHDAQRQQYKANMENLIEFYENQIYLAKIQLSEGHKPYISKLKNTMMSISENGENQIFVPLKDQIIEVVNKNPPLNNPSKKYEVNDNRSQFSDKYFQSQQFSFRNTIESMVKQEQSQYQQSSKKIILVESPDESVKSCKSGFGMGRVLSIIAGSAVAIFALRRFFQKQ